MKAIENKVLDILENLCLTKIRDQSQTLTSDLAMDSLRLVTLLVTLEDTFEIELDESDMNPFLLVTVKDVIELASKYVHDQGGTENA